MSGVWNAHATGMRFAEMPARPSAAIASSIAGVTPAMIVCCGALKLASQTPGRWPSAARTAISIAPSRHSAPTSSCPPNEVRWSASAPGTHGSASGPRGTATRPESAYVPSAAVLADFSVVPAGDEWTDDEQLMVCPNMRSTQIYLREAMGVRRDDLDAHREAVDQSDACESWFKTRSYWSRSSLNSSRMNILRRAAADR
mgnify:CR=1 FL=1